MTGPKRIDAVLGEMKRDGVAPFVAQRVLGLDPGFETGWCVYDPGAKRVVASGSFEHGEIPVPLPDTWRGCIPAIERCVPQGATRPQVVTSAWIGGRLAERVQWLLGDRTREVTRHEVRKALQLAVYGSLQVKDDSTVWQALKLLHGGDGADDKGKRGEREPGPLAGVKSHGRAALAVAWAVAQAEPSDGLPF
jgi:hypothetical protein